MAVSSSRQGEFIVVWNSDPELRGWRVDELGRAPQTGIFSVDDTPLDGYENIDPDIARQPGDGFVVAWQEELPDEDNFDGLAGAAGYDVFARRFDAAGGALGERFRISDFEPGDQTGPRVATSATGDFVVVWESRAELGPGLSTVFANRFAADGRPRGGRFPVHPSPPPQSSPAVASDARGNFVVVWEAEVAEGDFDIVAQRFVGSPCSEREDTLCLGAGRFEVQVDWRDFKGMTGHGHARPLTDDTGSFWFFGPQNLEVMVKVLDGRAFNGHFWVFYASLSNVEFTVRVRDRVTGSRRSYVNRLGELASSGDTQAFPGG